MKTVRVSDLKSIFVVKTTGRYGVTGYHSAWSSRTGAEGVVQLCNGVVGKYWAEELALAVCDIRQINDAVLSVKLPGINARLILNTPDND